MVALVEVHSGETKFVSLSLDESNLSHRPATTILPVIGREVVLGVLIMSDSSHPSGSDMGTRDQVFGAIPWRDGAPGKEWSANTRVRCSSIAFF